MKPRKSKKNHTNVLGVKKSRETRKITKGGKVIGSGGFGCIFKPALKCRDKNFKNSQISKLMMSKNAKVEYKDIVKFLSYLKKIPNYQNYFLVTDVSICKPTKLSEEDLENFDEQCKTLKKRGISEININHPAVLKKLEAVNMPFGGTDINDYIYDEIAVRGHLDFKKLLTLNDSLLDVFKHGILPMNKEHIYHCDLKDSNMLLGSDGNIRLIDWGLSCKYDGENSVPKILDRRPFQYNLPFSNIFFSDVFSSLYKHFLTEKKAPSYLETREFVIDFVFFWFEERGLGHLKSINNIVKLFFEDKMIDIDEEFKDQLLEFNYTFHFIFEYLTKILMKFTKSGQFDKIAYLKIFLNNVDIWGFVMTYITIVKLTADLGKMGPIELDIEAKIKDALILIYESADYEIDINKLTTILESLNPVFRRGLLGRSNKKSEKMSSVPSFSLMKEMKGFKNRTAKGLVNKFKKSKKNRKNNGSVINSFYKKKKYQKKAKVIERETHAVTDAITDAKSKSKSKSESEADTEATNTKSEVV